MSSRSSPPEGNDSRDRSRSGTPAAEAHGTYPTLVLWEDDADTRMVFRPIPPGRFRMGSRGHDTDEEPAHCVEVPPPRNRKGTVAPSLPAFWLAETPVTQAQFARWTNSPDCLPWLRENAEHLGPGPGPHANEFSGKPYNPADSVSWWEALAYCDWLNSQVQPVPGWRKAGLLPRAWNARATLPAEAHWEYACRAGSETEYCNGDGEAALRRVGWFGGNWREGSTHAVRQLEPNDWGLYDMHGNVWEWCLDEWNERAYRGRLDGTRAVVPEDGSDRAGPSYGVLRGGSWGKKAGSCRSAFRLGWATCDRAGSPGFRVCLLPDPSGSGEPDHKR